MRKLAFFLLLLTSVAFAAPATPVSEADQQAIKTVLKQLYDAYSAKNVDQVMTLIQGAVDASAAADPKGRTQEIKDAFRAFHEDLLTHPDLILDPFEDRYLTFEALPDGSIHVVSPVPVIASNSLVFKESDGTPTEPISLRLGDFTFQKQSDGTMRIVRMNL